VKKKGSVKASKDKIFISIASYRDPQLVPTLRDCVKNAKNPENLVFGICWQRDEKESLEEFQNDPRVKYININYTESKGTCWARAMIQERLFKNEKYYFQLDSHHRFVQNWDEKCIEMIKQLQNKGHKKPLLTGYISSFNPDNDPSERIQTPWKMNFDRFIPEGAVFFLPASIDDYKSRAEPLPARFVSAHFIFTLGKWVKEVPYDPFYYFHGEEINLAVRSFTWGYDLFHPHIVVAWHEYTRKGRSKHWDDVHKWGDLNKASHLRNRKLFEMDGEKKDIDFGKYDFGLIRSVADYEKYSGLCFKKRAVQRWTLDNNLAPNPNDKLSLEEYEKSFLKIFKHCIDIRYEQVPEKDYDFWCVAFKDNEGKDVYRRDADRAEIDRMFNDPDKYCKVWREFNAEEMPRSWIVWPHSVSKGWADPITGQIGDRPS
jgi:hypothetical protein